MNTTPRGTAMNDHSDDVGRDVRRKDTAEYSGSKAPETRREAEEHNGPSDSRLKPGGARGAEMDVGMSSLDRGAAVSGGDSNRQEHFGETSKEKD
jgi:hypothetical protein